VTGSRKTSPTAAENSLSSQLLHDLRTPLNQIIGYSEMLTEQAQDEGQTGYVPDLEEIHTSALQLLALLTNGNSSSTHFKPDVSSPVTRESTSSAVPVAVATAQLNGHAPAHILVVDDNARNRDMLSRRLQRQGYNVEVAEDGRKAIEVVRAQPFDLVLLDIMMPELDGYQVLQQLKDDEALSNIPVIMISALDEMDSVVRCIEMGAEDYLPKPFNPTLLKARISACLEKKNARDLALRFTTELQGSYKRLQELEKLRDDLTHMIIHDLRTPLTSVITGMQSMEILGDLNPDQQETMGIALDGGETLLGMINDLLDVEKLESGTMQLEYSALVAEALIASALAQVSSLAESKRLILLSQAAPGLPNFQGDAGKLTRTLVNLVGNAIKFTPSGGTITIEARLGVEADAIVFAVTDTGEGIPPESFERIFEKFGQVENRKAGRMMSTGLGLTFCKLAVEAHGGHIAVESTPGQGATFCYSIPLV
jgi:signal transduction histidine kinase